MIDGLGAGTYGVLLIVMMADLGKGTGRFHLLRGTTYAAIGLGVALSSVLGGFAVKLAGFTAAFATLAGSGCWRRCSSLATCRSRSPRAATDLPPSRTATPAP